MSEKQPLYPLLLAPSLHTHVWGGRRLESVLHISLPTDDPYGEAWGVHNTATVVNGPLAGQTLGDVVTAYGHAVIGPDNDPAEGFPLLAKFIDSARWLSVQVHPNDEQARRLEGDPRGKTEAWYILAAEPDSQLIIGVTPGTTREALAEAIRQNTVEDVLVYTHIEPGDVLFVRAGTIHAVGPGVLLYEIQQSSDMTYRLYDWGRLGLDGKPRALHIEKGVAVSNVEMLPEMKHTGNDPAPTVDIVASEYFGTVLHQLDGDNPLVLDTEGRRFQAFTCIEGRATVQAGNTAVEMTLGQSVLVPASCGELVVTGQVRLLRSFQPD